MYFSLWRRCLHTTARDLRPSTPHLCFCGMSAAKPQEMGRTA